MAHRIVSTVLPLTVFEQLKQLAEKEDRTLSWWIKRAIVHELERIEQGIRHEE